MLVVYQWAGWEHLNYYGGNPGFLRLHFRYVEAAIPLKWIYMQRIFQYGYFMEVQIK